ncbi:UDP-glucuronosyltransferase 1-5-like [Sinocyclocheilus rhinocerous]|uniref:UDP-glucuronosyltransferase 1-5-like n=1 Tax=Sinocyclocheilus rhinocerous TaxID=307959 RepID=UPI0007B9576F|nr:PREDICTED: UDP-glucuronosyltransferase 1-5-like [Sinocyclocheilus rhinocerous]
MKPIVEELGRRGNQVVVVFPEASLSMGPSEQTTTLTYPVNYTKAELEANLADQLNTILSIDISTDLAKFQSFIISLDVLPMFILRNTEGLLFNKDSMKKLQDYNFDAILTDPFEPVGAIAGEYLSVPAIYMLINHPCGVDTLASQCPAPASYVPQAFTHFTDHMNLWQRNLNLRKTSMMEIMSRAALWFLRFDFAVEFPRPVMPNMVMIGATVSQKPKPLSQVSLFCS